jgi:hypothetical protein
LAANYRIIGEANRVERTSHTGGHRFAPTALAFPDGTAWAFCDLDLISRVLDRRGSITEVLPRYRGCAGLQTRGIQILERYVLAQVGWELFDLVRSGHDTDEGISHLEVTLADGSTAEWVAEVTSGRQLPLPDCGSPLISASKIETEMVLKNAHRVR